MELQIAICDDEPILRNELKEKILMIRPEYAIDAFSCGKDLMECSKEYDMVFLDIEMPGEDGMEIARKLRLQNCKSHIIFLTSHTEYMPEAFKVKAFRFLEKPINTDSLKEALMEAEKEFAGKKKVVVNNFGTEILVDIWDIMYISADGKNTMIHMKNQKVETGNALKCWLKELEEYGFCQVHKSYIVSLRHIRQVLPEGIMLKETKEIIPLSRRRYNIVRNLFFQYIEEHAGIM